MGGTTYIMPDVNDKQQDIAAFFLGVFWTAYSEQQGHRVQSTSNISDRIENWEQNFRNPDLAYFSADTDAEDHDTFWFCGPDFFLLEILSPGDMVREELPIYAKIGTKQVLIVDREPWKLELSQLSRGKLKLVGSFGAGDNPLASAVDDCANRETSDPRSLSQTSRRPVMDASQVAFNR